MRPAALIVLVLVTACAAPGDDTDDTDDTDVDDTDVDDTDDTDGPVAVRIVSDSFEEPEQGAGGGFDVALDLPWIVERSHQATDGAGHLRPDANTLTQVEPLAAPADGLQVAWLAAGGDGNFEAYTSVRRQVVDAAEVGATYRATLALGRRLDLDAPMYLVVSLGHLSSNAGTPYVIDDHGVQLSLDPTTLPAGALGAYDVAWTVPEDAADVPVTLEIYVGSMSSAVGNRQILVDAVEVWVEAAE